MFFNIYDGAVSVREYSRSEMLRQQKKKKIYVKKKVHHKIQYIENRFIHTTDRKKKNSTFQRQRQKKNTS